MKLSIVTCPSGTAKTNRVHVNSYSELVGKFVQFDDGFIYLAQDHNTIPEKSIGMNAVQRKLHNFALNTQQNISVVDNLEQIDVVHAVITIPNDKNISIDCEEFEKLIKLDQFGTVFSEFQHIHYPYGNVPINIVVTTVVIAEKEKGMFDFMKQNSKKCGIITNETKFMFESQRSNVKLLNLTNSVGNKLFKKDLNLTELGIGGLDQQFNKIFRSAFASRVVPKAIAEKMNLKHRKGVLLYGPPGTGKTLIARQIGQLLNCKTIKVVSGPSLLNEYVGGSEKNVRELFQAAERDRDQNEDSLHLIIFDEADSLFKKRGIRNDSTGVADNVVNQILAKIDGVDQLNNILIIAMTNRKDSIDEAILRSGRLDIHIEIGLPTENGRCDILNIHTSKLHDRMCNINLKEIAMLTKNYTGAELENIVTSATSFAITRELDMSNLNCSNINPILTQNDFLNAIDDVPTLFGKMSDEIKLITNNPFVEWSDEIKLMRSEIMDRIDMLEYGNNMNFLITGSTGIGKTKLCADIIKNLNIACVKVICPEILLRTNNIQDRLSEAIDACSRAEISVLFLDGFERLIKWSKYGYRYCNDSLQLLMTILRLVQNADKKMIIFCTANSQETLKDLEIYDMFDFCYAFPETMTSEQLSIHFPEIKNEINLIDDIQVQKVMRLNKLKN